MNSVIYWGDVFHVRHRPKHHAFNYKFQQWCIDLSELDDVHSLSRWMSCKGFAPLWFRRKDYLKDEEGSLHQAALKKMSSLAGKTLTGHVFFVGNIRTFGIFFSPVNFYFLQQETGEFTYMLAEVSNTPWLQRHYYLVDLDEKEGIEEHLYRTKQYNQTNLQDNIGFEEESHKYYRARNKTGNADYISVTTLINRFFPFDMRRFIKEKAKREGLSEKEVEEEFQKNREEAARMGTCLHKEIECFLKGEEYDGNSKEFDMFKEFYQEIVVAKGFEFVKAEKRIRCEKHNIAGTVDALFKKPNKDEYLIVDWKRSKKLVVDGHPKKFGYGRALSELKHLDNSSYYKYALQQNIYKYILENNYQMSISSMNLIVLHENFDKFYRINLVNMDKEVSAILNSINHKT